MQAFTLFARQASIKQLLALRIGALIVVALILFACIVYWAQFKPTFDILAKTGSQYAALQGEEKIRQLFNTAESALTSATALASSGLLSTQDPAAFNRQILPLLDGHKTILGIHLASEHGEEMMLTRSRDGQGWANRQTRAQAWGTARQFWSRWDLAQNKLNDEWLDGTYDARTRPWFTQAMQGDTGQIYCSEPYIFATFQDPGITISTRWQDKHGTSWILAVDIWLLELSRFTSQLKFATNGSVAIFSQDGRLLGVPHDKRSSNDEGMRTAILKKPSEIDNESFRGFEQAWTNLQHEVREVFEFMLPDGQKWIGLSTPINVHNQRFFVAATAPYDDFTGVSNQLIWGLGCLLLTLALLSIWLSIRLSNEIASPLKRLVEESGRIGRRQLDTPVHVGSVSTKEITALVHAQEEMRQLLLKSSEELAEANRTLESRITQRTAAIAASEDRLRRVLEESPIGVAIVDQDGSYQLVNQSLAQIFRIPLENLKAMRSPQAWARPEEREAFLYKLNQSGQINNLEVEFQRPNGERFWVSLNSRYIELNERRYLLSWLYDISAQREARAAMESARDVAEQAARTKAEFLANMSHEIRTPMNAIIGMSHLALGTSLDDRQRNYIEKVHLAAENLLGILNDILDFSKIEAGKLDMEHVDFSLDDVMKSLAVMVGTKAEEKGLEVMFHLHPALPFALVGDALRLGQVLTNLANNALKFTEHGDIQVGVEPVAQRDNTIELHFWVKDSGIGISKEQQAQLFHSFSQADVSISRRYGGTGLGLAISKTLVDMMDGRIWVESEEHAGSCFHFHACFELSASESANARQSLDAFPGKRALIIDDNAAARQILGELLEHCGLQVAPAKSGQLAISLAKLATQAEIPFDVAFIDWHMPGMDGIECALALGALPQAPAIVMLTAYGHEEVRAAAKEQGLNIAQALSKPLIRPQLLAVLNQLFKEPGNPEHSSVEETGEMPESTDLAGLQLLLVEDNDMNQELARELLESAGIQVSIADNGQMALDILASGRQFDGILMDCQMPVMDGYQATEIIRRNQDFADLPIIAMTANAMSTDREKAIAVGMNDHITKPLQIAQMFATIRHWCHAKPATKPGRP